MFHQNLQNLDLEPLNVNSDHKPLVFSLTTKISQSGCFLTNIPNQTPQNNKAKFYRYLFNADAASGLTSSVSSEHCSVLHDAFIDSIISDKGVNDVVSDVYTLLETAISENFLKKYQKAVGDSFPRNEWFDNECKQLKRVINDFAKTHDLNLQDKFRQYHSLKKSFKAPIQRKKRNFQDKIRNELCALERKNPCDYWKYWDKLK